MLRRLLIGVAAVAAAAAAAVLFLPTTADTQSDGPDVQVTEGATSVSGDEPQPSALTEEGAQVTEASAQLPDDEVQASELDRDKWAVMTTATTGFTHASECYIDESSTVDVHGGSLHLTARKFENPYSCGGYPTNYVSGMVHTAGTFAQTYGRFEARIKFAQGSGIHNAWWMWPRDMAYGEQSGEIDIAEHWGVYPEYVLPFVHIKDPEGKDHGGGAYCTVANSEGEFHTYAVEWTPPGRIIFLYDGEPCMTFEDWEPADPLTYPQPFDQPFFLALTLALQYGAVNEQTHFPATMTVDYVHAWS
jgi:beta-glucanase (GH16 family)